MMPDPFFITKTKCHLFFFPTKTTFSSPTTTNNCWQSAGFQGLEHTHTPVKLLSEDSRSPTQCSSHLQAQKKSWEVVNQRGRFYCFLTGLNPPTHKTSRQGAGGRGGGFCGGQRSTQPTPPPSPVTSSGGGLLVYWGQQAAKSRLPPALRSRCGADRALTASQRFRHRCWVATGACLSRHQRRVSRLVAGQIVSTKNVARLDHFR